LSGEGIKLFSGEHLKAHDRIRHNGNRQTDLGEEEESDGVEKQKNTGKWALGESLTWVVATASEAEKKYRLRRK